MANACSKSIALFAAASALVACVRRAPPPPLIAVHGAPGSAHSSSPPQPPPYDPSTAASTGGETTAGDAARTTGTPTTPPTDGAATTAVVLPETISRDDVLRAVQGVDAQTRACGRGHPQTIMVRLTFSSSGELTAADPQESARGSAEASCLVAALRAARTQPFRAPSLQMWVAFSLE